MKIPKGAEIVSRQIRVQIVRGQLREGFALAGEKELMERYGVSRPTLREAIRILESEGLVSIQRGARGGAVVHQPNEQVATRYMSLVLQARGTNLIDIHRVHRVVEPAAARIVAEQFSRTAPPILRAGVQHARSVFDSDFEFGLATAAFRNKLIELTEIPTLSLLMGMINDIFQRYWGMMTVSAGERADNAPVKRKALRSLEKLIELREIPTFSLLMGMINDIFQRYWGMMTVSAGERADNAPVKRKALRSLEKLIEHIEQGDGSGAESHWRKHTELVEKGLRDWGPASQVIDLLDN